MCGPVQTSCFLTSIVCHVCLHACKNRDVQATSGAHHRRGAHLGKAYSCASSNVIELHLVMHHLLGSRVKHMCACADWLAGCGRSAGAARACRKAGGGIRPDVSQLPEAAADEDREDGAPPGHAPPAGACRQRGCRGWLWQVESPPLCSRVDLLMQQDAPLMQMHDHPCSCPAAHLHA